MENISHNLVTEMKFRCFSASIVCVTFWWGFSFIFPLWYIKRLEKKNWKYFRENSTNILRFHLACWRQIPRSKQYGKAAKQLFGRNSNVCEIISESHNDINFASLFKRAWKTWNAFTQFESPKSDCYLSRCAAYAMNPLSPSLCDKLNGIGQRNKIHCSNCTIVVVFLSPPSPSTPSLLGAWADTNERYCSV